MVFKFVTIAELTKGYHPAKFHCYRLSGSSFIEGLQKYIDDVMMTSIHIIGFEISIFCELIISYQSAKFQISQLSESNFTEVFIRHPQKPL